ncbi:hypothetical protein O181_052287 [Austropuccinia psidii MF-1]|uniref:Uncharacterized protein n=1 Tax=Austropuccinia psidii MF-1 TaxID=1389203 RepID=A0A9Q3E2L8_9BASI|nr:hypothetical protein [Austropuccinia psidii MF-1]
MRRGGPMRQKGAKGGSPLALKARWVPKPQLGPPEPFLAPSPIKPKMAIKTLRTTMDHFSAHGLWYPLDQLSSILPLISRGILPIPPWIPYSRFQEWCIYGIIYHYASFLLSNSMVTFSGPKSMISNEGPKIKCPFQSRILQLISLAIDGGYQKTIQGPQPPAPAGVGLAIFSALFQGLFSEVIHHSISFQGRKYFNTTCTTQLVHTGSNQLYLYVLGPIGPIHIPLWEFNHTVQFQDGQSCIGPIQTIQPVTDLPGSVFQLFTYTGHL